ncbi:ATP-binding cassette domain-containing protein [Chitinophaga pendula]|uniref:ABC transporter ATP-binding protein n=1 Tax=Chitinophaga TaxID=79328 RepID=UPI000BAFC3AC|nr:MULTISPECIES: ATP-binding cassette domain-containing protein [Chitinophaga]ASZ12367.1 glycine/betaine ABC transporter ATP-binding protein [Chitinophaga sp. MD30]UCJ10037.1 ATP-binding cassette domain-containing protein [Chitinophaga pendula]
MIHVSHVSKSFDAGIKAVDDVSFEVATGETMILLGTSGCGKTTTLRMLNRLIAPGAGTISIDGHPIDAQPVTQLRRSIGYVLQDNGLFPHYTVEENIAIVPRLLRWEPSRIRSRTNTLLEKLHLDPGQYLQAYPPQLSGGQQQRVGLARALAADPPILLMDEPFGALDPVTRGHVRRDFMALDELVQKTIVMVTHDIPEAFELADRICLMHQGRIQQTGAPADLLFRPANAFVRSFFDEQRLQLEFNVLKISDIWHLLPDQAHPVSTQPPADAAITYWQAMEQISQAPDGRIYVQHQQAVRSLDSQQLLTAFRAFKKQ